MQQILAQLLFDGAEDLEVAEMSPWLDLREPPKAVKLPEVEAQTHRRFLKLLGQIRRIAAYLDIPIREESWARGALTGSRASAPVHAVLQWRAVDGGPEPPELEPSPGVALPPG